MSKAVSILREKPKVSNLNGFGDTASSLQTAQSITNSVNSISKNIGAKPTNQTLNDVASTAAKLGAIAAVIPGGQVVAAVAGVVAAAAQVLSGVFGGSTPSTDVLNQTNGQNAVLLTQIDAIDSQSRNVEQALVTLKQALNQNGFNGFGAWYNDVISIKASTDSTPVLQQQLVDKGKYLQSLIEVYNKTVTDTYNAIKTKRSGQSVVLIGLVGLALGGVTWYLLRKTHGN